MIIRTCAAVLAIASLTACGEKAVEPASAPAAAAPAAAASAAAPATASAITLDGEGLKFAATTPVLMAFGAPAESVIAAARTALGSEPTKTANPDCPNGATEDYAWGEKLTIVTRGGAFVGWDSNGAGPTTASGLHAGSAKPAAVQGEDSQFDQQTISVDGVNGFLEDDKQTISLLYAGDTCIAG